MPSLWPFRRNKKKKQAQLEEKSRDLQNASQFQTYNTTRNVSNTALGSPAQQIEPSELPTSRDEREPIFTLEGNEKDTREPFSAQESVVQSPTDTIPGEPLLEIDNLAGGRSNPFDTDLFHSYPNSPPPEAYYSYTTQPLYIIPTLKSKRSSATSDILRTKSARSKSSLREREKEIRAFTSPIPIPQKSKSFSSGLLARDSKRVAGGLDRRLQRPASEISLPMAESLRTSFSGDSGARQHSFKVSAFDALSPRPTIRYGDRSNLASVREKPSRSAMRKDKGPAIPEESTMPSNPRARIKEMADSMDARTIRELMERDQRRRDRKKALDSDKLKRKLQVKLDNQKAEEAAAAVAAREANPPIELEGTPVPEDLDTTIEPSIPYVGNLGHENFEPASPISRRGSETSGRWTQEMSREDLTPMDPFPEHRVDSRAEHRLSSEQISMHEDDAVIESATAVRLSTISTSPPASPMISREKTISPSNLSNVLLASRDSPEPPVPTTGYLRPEVWKEPETSAKTGSSWTSIFRRGGTKRKASADKSKTQTTATNDFSNVSRESFLRDKQPSPIPNIERSFKREPTVYRSKSKFREDLPELPISPPQSRIQSPEMDRPLSPYVDDTRKLDDLNNNSNTVTTPIEDVHPAFRDQVSNSRHQSYQSPSPEPAQLSQSLASIDSEASWLSGRPRKRSSVPIGSLRESLTSLPLSPEGNEEFHEEPDFSRQDYSTNTIRGPGGLSAQLRAMQPTSADSDTSLRQDSQYPHEDDVKYDTVRGRKPNIIQKGPMARSREGLLDEYNPAEDESPVSPLSPLDGEAGFPSRADASIHRATSVKIGANTSHGRQLSAGSARLLDIPARSSSDAKRQSVVSAASTTRSPLVSPRESTISPIEPEYDDGRW